MRSLRTLTAATALATAALLATPLAAEAAAAPASVPTTATAAARPAPQVADPNGYVYAWYDVNFQNLCGWWTGNAANWGDCWNRASSLWNNRYPGANDDIFVYWGLNCSKARRGVYNGVYLADLTQWPFDWGTGQGSGTSLNDNIASHCVTNLP
ncbi:hypothetical protein [Streptomyces sp. NRRL S-87]|uniref:hypothetical protein n=1 Tax=Streptomyces sp. NRRL S-87 TaxID=1463920 RepID=UPI0004BEDC9E|nr:hypothetical protein [Streptomyces sp. NRRL S-87]